MRQSSESEFPDENEQNMIQLNSLSVISPNSAGLPLRYNCSTFLLWRLSVVIVAGCSYCYISVFKPALCVDCFDPLTGENPSQGPNSLYVYFYILGVFTEKP